MERRADEFVYEKLSPFPVELGALPVFALGRRVRFEAPLHFLADQLLGRTLLGVAEEHGVVLAGNRRLDNVCLSSISLYTSSQLSLRLLNGRLPMCIRVWRHSIVRRAFSLLLSMTLLSTMTCRVHLQLLLRIGAISLQSLRFAKVLVRLVVKE